MDIVINSNFSKRINSTKQPQGGIKVNVSLKGEVSISNPIFLLAEMKENNLPSYLMWNFKNRDYYYYVDDIVIMRNGIFEIHCSLDYMGTFRSEIMNSYQMIAYSTVKSDDNIQDRRLLPSTDMEYIKTWSNKSVLPNSDPCIVLTCASDNSVSTQASGGIGQYVFDDTYDFKTFISESFKMYDPITDMNEVVKKFLSGTSTDNLLSARYYHYTPPLTDETDATIGIWNSEQKARCISSEQTLVEISIDKNSESSNVVPFWGGIDNYLRNDTYCCASLYLPFIGVQNLDIDELAISTSIKIDYHYDNVNGTFKCDVYLCQDDKEGISNRRLAYTYGGSVSAEMTFSTFSNNPIQTYIEGAKAVGNVASLNFGGAIESAVGAVTGTTQAQTTITGGYESRVVFGDIDSPVLTIMYRHPIGIDIRDAYGAPYVKYDYVQNHKGGYIQTSNAEYGLSVTTLGKWHGVICDTMNSGFFVE